ncbi:hypothetical protein L3V79_02450 [Thiotrichales bacterium 19S9-12]|nr:hypothetical protein [Thiotrichales bacterium 19S9-11]MCF6811218.1 hypothetical protein [Thiotrichales bacterium 19S9-12]
MKPESIDILQKGLGYLQEKLTYINDIPEFIENDIGEIQTHLNIFKSIKIDAPEYDKEFDKLFKDFDDKIIDPLIKKINDELDDHTKEQLMHLKYIVVQLEAIVTSIETGCKVENTRFQRLLDIFYPIKALKPNTRKEVIAAVGPIKVPAKKHIYNSTYLSTLEKYLLSRETAIEENVAKEIIYDFKRRLASYNIEVKTDGSSSKDHVNRLGKKAFNLLLIEVLDSFINQQRLTSDQKKDIIKHTFSPTKGVRFAEEVDIAILPKGKKDEYKYKNEEKSNAPEQSDLIKIWFKETTKYKENLKEERRKKDTYNGPEPEDYCAIM